jgi:hypothetical protein
MWSHLGILLKVVAPTGNKPKGRYIFEPIVGNRGHWELGVGVSTHMTLWSNIHDEYSRLCLFFEGNVVHMFANDQIRSFDFKDNGFLSRYLLLKRFESTQLNAGGDSLFTQDYIQNRISRENGLSTTRESGFLTNAINFATRNAEVSIAGKGEAVAMLSYITNGFGWDVGYNIYGRSEEKVCIKTSCPCGIDTEFLGFKGTEGVGYFDYDVNNGTVSGVESSRFLNSTQSQSTIFSPTTTETVDNPQDIRSSSSLGTTYNSSNPAGQSINNLAQSVIVARRSLPPSVISCTDLDPHSAVNPRQLTHKLFFTLNYRWLDTIYCPSVGLGGEVEFCKSFKPCRTSRSEFKKAYCSFKEGLNQYGVWIKTSMVF